MGNGKTDIRIAVVGDSFVFGTNDPDRIGWVGRLPHPDPARYGLSIYNLGVRRDTSSDIAQRWRSETRVRLKDGHVYGLAFSFGVNDSRVTDGKRDIPVGTTLSNLHSMLDMAGEEGLPVLILGPPPVADPAHNQRTLELDAGMQTVARQAGARYVSVFNALHSDGVWMAQVSENDGAHPSREGYQRYADLVAREWLDWIVADVVGGFSSAD